MIVVLFLIGVLANLYAFLGPRYALARKWGGSGGLVELGLQRKWRTLSMGRRVLFALVGPASSYLCAVAFFAIGFCLEGNWVTDDASMRVTVNPDGPAAKAGVRDGDRMVSVDSDPTPDWPTLKTRVSAHAKEVIEVKVERDGREIVLSVTPDAAGRINVSPPSRLVDLSVGQAIGKALVEPLQVNWTAVQGFIAIFAGREKPVLSGPARIVQMTKGFPLGRALKFVAMMNAYYLWVPTFLVLILFPRVERKPSWGVA
jgi:membrane-associated protease RseP (regulator of RpoE activity)